MGDWTFFMLRLIRSGATRVHWVVLKLLCINFGTHCWIAHDVNTTPKSMLHTYGLAAPNRVRRTVAPASVTYSYNLGRYFEKSLGGTGCNMIRVEPLQINNATLISFDVEHQIRF